LLINSGTLFERVTKVFRSSSISCSSLGKPSSPASASSLRQ